MDTRSEIEAEVPRTNEVCAYCGRTPFDAPARCRFGGRSKDHRFDVVVAGGRAVRLARRAVAELQAIANPNFHWGFDLSAGLDTDAFVRLCFEAASDDENLDIYAFDAKGVSRYRVSLQADAPEAVAWSTLVAVLSETFGVEL